MGAGTSMTSHVDSIHAESVCREDDVMGPGVHTSIHRHGCNTLALRIGGTPLPCLHLRTRRRGLGMVLLAGSLAVVVGMEPPLALPLRRQQRLAGETVPVLPVQVLAVGALLLLVVE